jgi:3'(2'), 5'-bisphosphate nucleotidase
MINDIIRIAEQASILIMEVYESDQFGTEYKEDSSPLTIADMRASNLICSELRKLTPHIPIICEEEGADVEYNIRKIWTKFWLVDPLDGTKEFVKKNGEFTVNIALIEDNKPILGVVAIPSQKLIYHAEKGKGAYCINCETGRKTKLQCEPLTLCEPIIMIASRSHMNDDTIKFFDLFKVKNTLMIGSALKFTYLCENRAQVYPRLSPCMEWDIAAADIVLSESGGSIWILNKSLETEELMWYNKPSLVNPNFVAFSGSHSNYQ